ncbi:hypothetical protein AYK59_07430 [Pseudomonas synxantha]|nr:hypothetical protein AYK59_07430 [Pseudomonas synxantha]
MQRKHRAGMFQHEGSGKAYAMRLRSFFARAFMDKTPGTAAHPSTQAVHLPPLSPPFISADDAVYWAHRQILHGLEWEFGGVILKDKEGYFRATAPKHGEAFIFRFEEVLPADKVGYPIAPAGFEVVAIYHSHAARHGQVRATGLTDAETRFLLGSFLPEEMLFNLNLGAGVPVHYLSGPDGSLIKYVCSGSATEHALFERLLEDIQGTARDEYVHTLSQESAAAGELWVVVPNQEWGGVRGRVKPGWEIGTAVTSRVEALPLCTRVFALADKAAMAALDNRAPAGAVTHGFILKSTQGYVATWPEPATPPWFSPAVLFPVDDNGSLRLPEHCALQGAYVVVPDKVGGLSSVPEPWLYKSMFSALQLAVGIGQLKVNADLGDQHSPMDLYFKTSDRAVLRYRLSGSAQEATLFTEPAPGRFSDDGSEQRMASGALASRDYVLRVAQAGQLAVIRTSQVWDEKTTLTQDWQPYSIRQQPLSPAFVTADDAARYAHAQVDYGRLSNYAALILQRADQRFIVTQPVSTQRPRFALDAVYPLDEHGALIMLTPSCRLHALFCSRAMSEAPQGLSASEAQVAQQMFMDTDIHTLLSNRQAVACGYLSGSVDSLLAYTTQDLQTYTERELLERVTPVQGHSPVARALSGGELLPSAFVREQAYPGRLRVVVAGRLWGAAGPLPEDWQPGDTVDITRLPQTPLLSQVFASAADAVRNAHKSILDRYGRPPSGLGVVLRHRSLAQYVTTQWLAPQRLDQLLHTCRFAESLQQAGFEVDSFYLSSVRVPDSATASGGWLARHFIGPGDLQAAIYDNAGARRLPLAQRLTLHIATLEGALLAYDAGSDDRLFGADAQAGQASFKRRLDSDELSTTDFVRHVASAGALRVVDASECWDQPGQINPSWAPFSGMTRRRLSPAFSCADDAARYASTRLGDRRDQVYGGLILRSTAGLFVATEPLVVHVENFDVQWVRSRELVDKGLFLGGSTVVAFYHSCSAYEPQFPTTDTQWNVYRNMYSTAFVADVLRDPSQQAASPRTDYLLCNDGALLRYRFTGNAAQKALAAELNVAPAEAPWHLYNPIEEQIRAGILQPAEWVNRLAYAGELAVLQGSQLWGNPRPVVSFLPYEVRLDLSSGSPVQADTGLTPLFTQAADAVRYVHRLSQEREQHTCGFIFKAASHAHFMASLPMSMEAAAGFSLNRVLLDGQQPQGFVVNGLYLRARIEPQAKGPSSVHSGLRPQDLAAGAATAARYGHVPLYVLCADGTLLQLDTSSAVSERDSVEATLRRATPVPAPNDHRLALSPVFVHSDDAARYAQRLVGPYQGDDFLGAILEDLQRRAYVAVEPLPDNDPDAVPSAEERLFWKVSRASTSDHEVPLPEYPEGHRVVMTHQLYKSDFAQGKEDAATSLGVNFISWSYIHRYTRGLRGYFDIQNYYLSTRDGALLRYTPDYSVDSQEETMVHQFNHIGVYDAREMLRLMAPYKTLNVVLAGHFWRRKGLIGDELAAPVAKASPTVQDAPPGDGFHREKDEF